MIEEIVKKFEKNLINDEDVKYILNLKNYEQLEKFYITSKNIQTKNFDKTYYETNIYYPDIYQIENNCPTCGYRSIQSRSKYNESFIRRAIEYKFSDIDAYPLSGVNCYNKDTPSFRELLIILNTIEKYDLKVNVKISDYNFLKKLEDFDINSIIFQSSLNKINSINQNNGQKFLKKNDEVLEYIKKELKLKITYEFLIDYGESYLDIVNKINEMKKYDVDIIEIKGYDPFIDCPEEYNPQYTEEYILKIISLLRIAFPHTKIKLQYATNKNNNLQEYICTGVNIITGIYTPKMNNKLQNVDNIF